MHPALSVIFFTVSSGAGFGLYILLVILGCFIHLSKIKLLTIGSLSIVLTAIGLISSTFHLSNPKNAWRALSQFKTSWLSREGVFALLFFPLALGFLTLTYFNSQDPAKLTNTLNNMHVKSWMMYAPLDSKDTLNNQNPIERKISPPKVVLAVLSIVIALLCLISTGMIYASLKTIPQWHTLLTPLNYLFIGLGSGGLILFPFIANLLKEPLTYAYGLSLFLSLGFVIKLKHFSRNQRLQPLNKAKALGLKKKKLRLSNKGHSAPTFLDKEFGYELDNTKALKLQFLALFLTYLMPITLLLMLSSAPRLMMILAILFSLCGAILERWLFFATANHVVNNYRR